MMIEKLSLRHKIVSLVALMIITSMCFAGLYFYWSISSILTKNAYDSLNQLIEQANNNLQSSFGIINNTSLHFFSNANIRSWITGTTFNDEDYYNLFQKRIEMEEDLKYSMIFNNAWDMELITTAYMFLNESSYFSVSRSAKNVQIVDKDNIDIFNKLIYTKSLRGMVILPPSPDNNTIYFARISSNVNDPEQRVVLIIGTDEIQIYNKYKSLLNYPDSTAYIIDNNGIIYSSSDRGNLGQRVDNTILNIKNTDSVTQLNINGQEYIVASKKVSNTDLTFIVGMPRKHVLERLYVSMRNYLLITIFIILVFLTAGVLLSLRFTRFIGDMLKNIYKIKEGNYDTRMSCYKSPELSALSDAFNKMAQEIKYLISQVYEKQLLLKETEFKFLQSQMNPHFLFNTLVTISYKARLTQDESVYKMVVSLTELLQASIYKTSKPKITIREELELIKLYLYLQKMRFEDNFEYSIEISDPSVLDLYVPKLSVEPIVENAVVHGLENKLGKGKLLVNILNASSSLFFEISDNGVGFDMNYLNLNDIENIPSKGHNQIGLKNTDKRIKLIYGNQYGISIENFPGKGCKVILHIPVDRGDDLLV